MSPVDVPLLRRGDEFPTAARNGERKIEWKDFSNAPGFILIHLACLTAFYTGIDAFSAGLCAVAFFIRKFGITAGYHRYFAHRSYRMGRAMQFLFALAGGAALQKGPLWWAGHHRSHHQNSDQERDIHSAIRDGFWWAHMGWILSPKYDETNLRIIPDFARFPELRWLNRFYLVTPGLLATLCFALDGMQGLVWGFFVSTVLLWHSTFLINSACHLFGSQRFPTKDTSRNSFWLALVTLGEGWHNNHHYFPSSARQGFYWWEIDISYYALKALSWTGLIWDLRDPPARVLALGRQPNSAKSVSIREA